MLPFLLLLGSSFALAEDLICGVRMNTQPVLERKVSLTPNAADALAEFEGFRLKLRNLSDGRFEIEAYDSAATTRSYAEAHLRTSKDTLKWTFWSRDILLETSCALQP